VDGSRESARGLWTPGRADLGRPGGAGCG